MQPRTLRTARFSALPLLVGLWSLAFVVPAMADPPPPLLSPMTVIDVSTRVARQVPGVKDLMVVPTPYDPQFNRWVTLVKPDVGEGFIVILDETTGEVCAQYEHGNGCAAKGSALAELSKVKSAMLAKENARLHPIPDMENLWITVVELAAKETGTDKNPSMWYLTVAAGDGTIIDIPTDVVAKMHVPGLLILPGSKAPAMDSQNLNGGPIYYRIGLPLRREDGNYSVQYSHYCGAACAASRTVVMSHDSNGWHVISSTIDFMA